MKRIILVLVTVMMITVTAAQTNNLFWTMRVKVKMDKKLEWEKKAPLLMKNHYPQYTFRVYEVSTGPNTGSYVLSIGPMSYKDFDAPPVFPKGAAAAKADRQALDAICESVEVTHYQRDEEISNVRVDRQNKYAQLTFVEIEIGSWEAVRGILTKVQAVRKINALKEDIGYFRPANSGPGNMFAVVRYLEKWEELEMDNKFPEMYNKAHGENAFTKDRKDYFEMVKSMTSELWVLRPDLGSTKSIVTSSN